MNYTNMTLANAEEGKRFREEAMEWLDSTVMWSTSKYAAYSAVAEYIANQECKTLYTVNETN